MEKVVSRLSELPPGSVRTLVYADVLDGLARIEMGLREAAGTPFVSVGWSGGSRVHDGMLDELAGLAARPVAGVAGRRDSGSARAGSRDCERTGCRRGASVPTSPPVSYHPPSSVGLVNGARALAGLPGNAP